MADSLGELALKISVDPDTGKLTVLSGEVKGLESAIGKTGQAAQSTTSDLVNMIGGVASVAAVVSVIKEAVAASASMQDAFRGLKTAVDGTGESFAAQKPKIDAWLQGMESNTKFSQDKLVPSLTQATIKLGNVADAMNLVHLSANIATATGEDLNATMMNLSLAAEGNQRGILMLHRQFGQLVEGADTTQKMFDILTKKFGDNTIAVKTTGDTLAQAKNQAFDFAKSLGDQLAPAVGIAANAFTGFLKVVQTVMAEAEKLIELFISHVIELADELKAIWSRHWRDITDIHDKAAKDRQAIENETGSKIVAIWSDHFKKLDSLQKVHVAAVKAAADATVPLQKTAADQTEKIWQHSATVIENGMAQAFAKTIIEGESMQKAMKKLSVMVAEQFIEDGIKIAVQAAESAVKQQAAHTAVAASAQASSASQVAASVEATAAIHAETAAIMALDAALKAATIQALALDAALAGAGI